MGNVSASLIAWALPYIITAVGAITALAAIWFGGRKSAKTDAKLKQAKAAAKSTKGMNDADTLRDADDDERIERLRQFERDNRS